MNILEEANKITSTDRNQDYGHPYDNHDDIARGWEVILGLLPTTLDPAKVALCMIWVKLCREKHRAKRDNSVDIAGYAWVLSQIRARQEEIMQNNSWNGLPPNSNV